MKNAKRDSVTALFAQFAGQEKALVIPRPYIDFCGGDHLAALLLSQILYWSDRTDDPDGWFAKSYEDWHTELCMTDYQIKRAIMGDKRRKGGGFCLKDIGVESKLKQSKFYGGAATLHYRINQEVLKQAVNTFLDPYNVENEGTPDLDNVQIAIPTMSKTGPLQCQERSTESTTENITESTKELADTPTAVSAGEVETPDTPQDELTPKPLSEQQLLFGELCEVFGYDPGKLDKEDEKDIGLTVSKLRGKGAKPGDIRREYKFLKEVHGPSLGFENFTYHALAKYWKDYAATLPSETPEPDKDAPYMIDGVWVDPKFDQRFADLDVIEANELRDKILLEQLEKTFGGAK